MNILIGNGCNKLNIVRKYSYEGLIRVIIETKSS